MYFETTNNPNSAITKEKQLKGWLRRKKVSLINETNPGWKDLAENGFSLEGTER